jgi:hypothetical protein
MGYAIAPMQERWNALEAGLVLGLIWATVRFSTRVPDDLHSNEGSAQTYPSRRRKLLDLIGWQIDCAWQIRFRHSYYSYLTRAESFCCLRGTIGQGARPGTKQMRFGSLRP